MACTSQHAEWRAGAPRLSAPPRERAIYRQTKKMISTQRGRRQALRCNAAMMIHRTWAGQVTGCHHLDQRTEDSIPWTAFCLRINGRTGNAGSQELLRCIRVSDGEDRCPARGCGTDEPRWGQTATAATTHESECTTEAVFSGESLFEDRRSPSRAATSSAQGPQATFGHDLIRHKTAHARQAVLCSQATCSSGVAAAHVHGAAYEARVSDCRVCKSLLPPQSLKGTHAGR